MNLLIFIAALLTGIAGTLVVLRMRKPRQHFKEEHPVLANHNEQQNSVAEPKAEENDRTAQIRKELNNLFLVNELSQRITSSLSLEESFSHLYHMINSMMDASAVELVVYDGNPQFYSNRKYERPNTEIAAYNHFSEWCYKNKKEAYLEDAENDYGRYVFSPLILPDGKPAGSLMCFPVSHHENITGTLCIISFAKNAFELFHLEMIRLLLPFIGVAINNASNHQEIIDLKIRAERSEQFMQVFLANMSHEIRTPMNAVMGMTNLLLQKSPLPEQLKYLNTIQKSSENLLVILNDILDLSKIEAGKMELEKIDFPVRDVIGNVKEIMQFKAEEKGLSLTANVDENIPPVLTGDPTRLTQILINLAGNAVKFTEKGDVRINIELVNSKNPESVTLKFSVIDSGIGMNEIQQKKLFQNYTQASNETTRKYGGTGLGLSISKQLVELQGGKIDIVSEAGKGSTFSFVLEYPVSKNKVSVFKEQIVSDEMLRQLSGLRVLLADDNEYNRIVVKETLELKIPDVKIDEAIDGLKALEMLRHNDYDLVLMDLVMPQLNGLEATDKIRKEFTDPKNKIPIIAITASVVRKEIDKCYAAGMNGFIAKPFKTSDMVRTLYNVLKGNKVEIADDSLNNTPAKNSDRLVDVKYLNEISEGDTVRMKRYAQLFIKSSPAAIAELKASVRDNNFEKVRIAAHSMKSQLKFNGIIQGYELAERIELDCLDSPVAGNITSLISELEVVCQKAVIELNELQIG
jgi:signal transduction histidine kinase/CheY-like chemotaxis protein/HPt (histidine-containing phosphotransfer) domain-containing protein